MIRYDQEDKVQEKAIDKDIVREQVSIDSAHQKQIVNLFVNQLRVVEINGVKIFNAVTHDTMLFNSDISLDQLSEHLGKKLASKEEFVREFYMYQLDKYTDIVYGKPVTAIQENPYSFQTGDNENFVSYEFIT